MDKITKSLPINRHFIDGNKLTIENTTEDDDGAYVCQGANELGSVMAVTWIFVKDVGKLKNLKNKNFCESKGEVVLTNCI